MFESLTPTEARKLDLRLFSAERENKGLLAQRHRSEAVLMERAGTCQEIISIRDLLYLERGSIHGNTGRNYSGPN